jgi:hypothetical protein
VLELRSYERLLVSESKLAAGRDVAGREHERGGGGGDDVR